MSLSAYPWGKTGHRVVGQIAENNLSKKARNAINEVLGGESLAIVSNYMDFIRSDNQYDHMAPWHYCTIPDDKTYEQAGTPEEGDAIVTINRLIAELKSKEFTDRDEAFALKCLVHLIADVHQPLHVGNGSDRGGNDIKVKFFWKDSNLHRVWDSGMIDNQQLSFTEWTDWLTSMEYEANDDLDIMTWVRESKELRKQVYIIPEDQNISYKYEYANLETVKVRLYQAGIRLAGILNEIYG